MDRTQDELKLLGFVGIYKESFKTIFRRKKLFTLITLTLILPLCIVSIAHSKFSQLFFGKIMNNTDFGAYDLNDNDGNGELTVTFAKYGVISLWLSKVVYFTLYFIFSLLPTSVIANAVFSTDATFTKAVTMVPKSSKKLLITFLWSFCAYSIFNLVFLAMLIMWIKFIWPSTEGIIVIVIIVTLYIGILPYFLMIWQLANLVSIFEDLCGRQALQKSWGLMNGKRVSYISCYVLLFVVFLGVHLVFYLFSGIGDNMFESGGKFMVVFSIVLLLMILELLRLVMSTVVYLVCKSYHHENVDGTMQTHYLELQGRAKDVHPQKIDV